ncbi:MAG: hypothetical protein ACE5IY_13685, partial [bacterium]
YVNQFKCVEWQRRLCFRYEDFISPLVFIGNPFAGSKIVKIGDEDFDTAEFTSTYVNFGEVNIQGFDLGATIKLNKHVSV